MKHEMRCMDGSGCTAILSIEGVGRAVPTKVVDKLAFYQQQAEISAAGIEGLEQCPHCEYKAICDPIEEDSVFVCQNSDCGKNTCRKCKEQSHLPKSCDEAKKDKGLSARHVIEEARSQAMMRKCPKCKAKIIKELGCNKMVCSCGNMMCYVCQQDISSQAKDGGYQHFHKAGSKCPLYDVQGTERHDEDANAAEKAAIKQVKAQEGNEDLEDKELQIETGKEKAKKKKIHRGDGLNPDGVANAYAGLANVLPFAAFPLGFPAPFPNPDFMFNHYRPPRVVPVQDDQQRDQRRAMLQQQMEQLRAQGDELRRARDALETRRFEDMNRAAEEAQEAARAAQRNVDWMMGAGYAGQGGGADAGGRFGGLFNALAPGYNVFDPYRQPPAREPQVAVQQQVEQEDLDDMETLMFGARPAMHGRADLGGFRQPHRQDQQRRNRNATQEELGNLEFTEYVLGPNRR